MSLTVAFVHQLSFTYIQSPPPLLLLQLAVLSAWETAQPASAIAASGVYWSSQVSVVTITHWFNLCEVICSYNPSILLFARKRFGMAGLWGLAFSLA